MNLKLINIKSLGGVHKEGIKWLRGADLAHFPTIENAYLIIKEGKISSFGPMSNCPQDELPVQNCNGQHVMPAFVDSHSHLVLVRVRKNSTYDLKVLVMRKSLQLVEAFSIVQQK